MQCPNCRAHGNGRFCEYCGSELLAIFLGYFGAHHFYVGKIGMGILYFLTAGIFGIGWIVDICLIASGSFKDSNGLLLKP